MGKPYSMDLRERVVAAVRTGGLSCNRAAKQFGIGISTANHRDRLCSHRRNPGNLYAAGMRQLLQKLRLPNLKSSGFRLSS
jgi:hypothetical protein